MKSQSLTDRYEKELIRSYERYCLTRPTGDRRGTRYRKTITVNGAVQATQRLLLQPSNHRRWWSEWLDALESGNYGPVSFENSLEYICLKAKYAPLFRPEAIQEARTRLFLMRKMKRQKD